MDTAKLTEDKVAGGSRNRYPPALSRPNKSYESFEFRLGLSSLLPLYHHRSSIERYSMESIPPT
jgi:hypothetical protein